MNPIIQTLHDNLPALKAKYPLQSLAIFGSYSRGEQNPNSDLDVLYEALPNTFLDLYDYLNLQRDLAASQKAMHYGQKYNSPKDFFKADDQVHFNGTSFLNK